MDQIPKNKIHKLGELDTDMKDKVKKPVMNRIGTWATELLGVEDGYPERETCLIN